jgi:tetratricopeptide (TPR) repeat protein
MNTGATLHEFFVAGGTLWGEAPSYVVRSADDELYNLALAGEYCNILAARQMGKSSLMVRTALRLQEAGMRTAILDMSILGGGSSTLDAWYYGFLDELAFQLGLDEDIDAWWEAHLNHSPVQRFSNFLRDVVLVEVQAPLAIFVDEIDSALGLAFTDDFFAAIRAMYNARASQPEFQRLTFILLGVARPADLIRDRNRTPYNIGTHIHLDDFTLPELHPFETVFEAAYPGQGQEMLTWVLAWTNGQPYLTQKLCAELTRLPRGARTPEDVQQTVTRLFLTEEARKESNLRAIQDRIESSPHKIRMLQIYEKAWLGKAVVDEERSPAKTELKLTGLLRASDQGRLEVRNRIYRTVFDQVWVRRNVPETHTRRFAILASLIAIVAFLIAAYALYQQQRQPSLTYAEQFQTSSSPDVRLTSLARLLELDSRSTAQAYELYESLSYKEQLSLFTDLSNPQNVASELVTVIGNVYQDNDNSPAGNQVLDAMKTVLGQIGAPGAPSLKTEIEFWLKGREEASERQNDLAAVILYDSAWDESQTRGDPNYAVRFDRATALLSLEAYAAAYDDLQAVWEAEPDLRQPIIELIQANPDLAKAALQDASANQAITAYITPIIPAASPVPTRTLLPAVTEPASPVATQPPVTSPSPTPEVVSPYTGWIVYAYGEASQREIYIMNPETETVRQITNNGVIDETPSFSPDSWKIVYASYRSQSGWDLYAYDLRRGTEQQLTAFEGQARFPAWSPLPGDTRIVFEGRVVEPERAVNIWLLDAATGEMEQLTSGGVDARPGWSPDGRQIVFGRPTKDTTGDGLITANDAFDIYILDLDMREEINLTNTPDFDDFNFAWSPDGEWIAFTSVRSDANEDGAVNLSDSRDLFLIRTDGSEERRLDLDEKAVFSPSWSPDGRYILFLVALEGGQNQIWRYNVRSRSITHLTEPGSYLHPAYSRSP